MKTEQMQLVNVAESDKQAFDYRRKQLQRHLPDPSKVWRWSWLRGRLGEQILERMRRSGYIDDLTTRPGWRRQAEPGWWRVNPDFWKWCEERYGLEEEQGPGVRMLVKPETHQKARSSTNTSSRDGQRATGVAGRQLDLNGRAATHALAVEQIKDDLRRRKDCGKHANRIEHGEVPGQLTVDDSLQIAATRRRWRKNDIRLPQPRGNAYSKTRVPKEFGHGKVSLPV